MSFQTVVGAWVLPNIGAIGGNTVITEATALEGLLKGNANISNVNLLLGTGVAGCPG